jgi:hypothetical protein
MIMFVMMIMVRAVTMSMIVFGTVGMVMIVMVLMRMLVFMAMIVLVTGMVAIVVERVRPRQGLGHKCHCANHNDNDDCYSPPKNVSVKCLLKNILQ